MQLACQFACSEFAAWGRKGNACQRASLPPSLPPPPPAPHDHARLEARVDAPQHAQTAQEPHLQRLVHIVREFEGAVRDREIHAEILANVVNVLPTTTPSFAANVPISDRRPPK